MQIRFTFRELRTALLLSAVSFYSLVAFGLAQRTRDIGIRVALGATGGQIVRSVLSRELAVLFGGSLAGVLLGTALYRIVTLVPFDLRPAGPSLLVVVSALLLCVGAGACVMPLARAMRVDPATVLRAE